MSTSATPRSAHEPAIIVIAKSPVAGRVKTRCTPPCSPEQAAALATAALVDSLKTVSMTSARRLVIALDGEPGGWLPEGFEVIPQCVGALGERLDHAFRSVGQPALLVGMDTPQMTVSTLDDALATLRSRSVDSVVGRAGDGGFWALGLLDPNASVCTDVPMSRSDTFVSLRTALAERRMTCALLPELIDVDDFETARRVAATVPGSGFADAIHAITAQLVAGSRR